jgi:alkanesulfonate monooxygenase SsuD/methylene tetrahydromethanopterin reductase-like flavin-dependent oxidoreductase (luciferase family)
MGAPASLGIRLPNSGPFARADVILRTADAAVGLGFRTLWVHDHISWPQEQLTHFAMGAIEVCADQPPDFYESISTCAVLAGRHPDVTVGVAGLVLPFRDPRVLAKQLATIERLTSSRFILAPVIGNIRNDFHVMGVPWEKRGAITREYLKALRSILAAETQPIGFAGRYVSWDDGTFLPRPASLPIWVGGISEPGIKRAVDYGDGFLTAYSTAEEYAGFVARIRELAAATGRSLAGYRYAYETFTCVADTFEKAMAICRATLDANLKGVERALTTCLIGTPDDVMERIAEYEDVGVDHIELKFISHSPDQMADMMAMIADRRRLRRASSDD